MNSRKDTTRTVTSRQVAERAGVSIMTVSLALRGGDTSDRMTAETRERVMQAARELGYTPNARARALRLGRTNVIGLYGGHGYINVRIPFFTELVSGLQEGCEQIHRDLLIHGVYHGNSEQDIFAELVDGRLDGLIVSLPQYGPLAKRLADSPFAVVAVADPIPGIPSVTVNDADGSAQIAQHLFEKGHRRIVYFTSPDPNILSAERRRSTFFAEAERMGMAVSSEGVIERAPDGNIAQSILEAGATAAVCWNDLAAHYIVSCAKAAGLEVPEQLAVVGFDGCPGQFGQPLSVTTVQAPWAEVARTAVLHLDSLIRGESVPNETELPVQLLPGLTT